MWNLEPGQICTCAARPPVSPLGIILKCQNIEERPGSARPLLAAASIGTGGA